MSYIERQKAKISSIDDKLTGLFLELAKETDESKKADIEQKIAIGQSFHVRALELLVVYYEQQLAARK